MLNIFRTTSATHGSSYSLNFRLTSRAKYIEYFKTKVILFCETTEQHPSLLLHLTLKLFELKINFI